MKFHGDLKCIKLIENGIKVAGRYATVILKRLPDFRGG